MAPIGEPVVAITLRALLIPLFLILVWAVRAGLAHTADILARALFGSAESAVGWIPWVGGKVKGRVADIGQRVSNYMGLQAAQADGQVGLYFHNLASMFGRIGDSIVNLAVTDWHFYSHLFKRLGVDTYRGLIHDAHRVGRFAGKLAHTTATRVGHLYTQLEHATVGKIGAAIHTNTRPIVARLVALEHWTIPRIRGLEREVERSIPRDIAGLRARTEAVEDFFERVWKRVRRLDRLTVGTAFAGAVAVALGRLGLGWLRCRNTKNVGKALCGMDFALIDALLTGALFALAVVDPVAIAKAALVAEDGLDAIIKRTAS